MARNRRPTAEQKRRFQAWASGACEYCQSQAAFSSQPFAVEHILPFSKGGKTALDNLVFSCQGCNNYKFTSTTGVDSVMRKTVALFNQREQIWNAHFVWNDDFTLIIGVTPTGRATVKTLQLNREGCVNLRRALYQVGKHPPNIWLWKKPKPKQLCFGFGFYAIKQIYCWRRLLRRVILFSLTGYVAKFSISNCCVLVRLLSSSLMRAAGM